MPAALLSSALLYFVFQEIQNLDGLHLELFLLCMRFFVGIFSICLLCLGIADTFRFGKTISMSLIRGDDLNGGQFHNQLQRFIVVVAEADTALLVLYFTGFVDIKW
jgi:hypothetical protein